MTDDKPAGKIGIRCGICKGDLMDPPKSKACEKYHYRHEKEKEGCEK